MNTLVPGWAEAIGKALASKDEGVRAEAMQKPRLRCFRRSESKNFDSCRRGGMLGAVSKAARKKLSEPGLTAGTLYVQCELEE